MPSTHNLERGDYVQAYGQWYYFLEYTDYNELCVVPVGPGGIEEYDYRFVRNLGAYEVDRATRDTPDLYIASNI